MGRIYSIALSIFIFLSLASVTAMAQTQSIVVIDTPTAYTIGRGTYDVSFLAYDQGGVELKTLIGLHDNLFLGISVDIQDAIGQEEPKPNIPGVIARIKIADAWTMFQISIAMGYDSFYSGREGKIENDDNELNRMVYGPYLAISTPIYILDAEQFVNYGIRVPTQPDYLPDDTSYFIGFDIPLGQSFRFKTELEKIYWDFERSDDWLWNVGLRYTYLEQLGIEVDVMMQKDERPNRVVRIEYIDRF